VGLRPVGNVLFPGVQTCADGSHCLGALEALGFRAFGEIPTDFSLSALRLIVAVRSFIGFAVRALDFFMNVPRISPPMRLRRNCPDVES
jgi:hypothetical protein